MRTEVRFTEDFMACESLIAVWSSVETHRDLHIAVCRGEVLDLFLIIHVRYQQTVDSGYTHALIIFMGLNSYDNIVSYL